ncbi:GNAT family N-acetyltransferase [Bailinhaonella thermotolerans]|uniref:GNAT family N-acetyltransferase n=1 Tax=Bailinhaonella thermotolerans TaxID=1070861 RepID=UPI003BEED701
MTRTQIRAWRQGYRDFLPEEPLAEMTGEQAGELWRTQWEEAVVAPPTSRHRLLVAVENGQVVGLAAHEPAEDPDVDPGTTAELLTLLVDPGHERRGHGSRLLNATVDHLREDGFSTIVTWVFAEHHAMLGFLESAGWGEDGAERVLDMGRPVRMVRLATDIS